VQHYTRCLHSHDRVEAIFTCLAETLCPSVQVVTPSRGTAGQTPQQLPPDNSRSSPRLPHTHRYHPTQKGNHLTMTRTLPNMVTVFTYRYIVSCYSTGKWS
jgi:hypothetical protein